MSDQNTKGIRLFVYGTLKSNHCNGDFLERAGGKFIGYDSITGPYKMLDYDVFPVVLPDPNKSRTIMGEVYLLDSEESLATIDFYEGHPNYFKRSKLTTDHKHLKVWVYMGNVEGFNDQHEVHEGPWQPSEKEAAFWEVTF